MKKLFSIVLTATILFSTFMPMAFAEESTDSEAIAIAAADTTVIETEDHGAAFHHVASDGTTGAASSSTGTYTQPDGTVIGYTCSDGETTGALVQTLNLSVEDAGVYNVELISAEAEHLSNAILAIDGVDVAYYYSTSSLDKTLGDGTTEYYFGNQDFPAYKKSFRVELSAGSHTLSLTYDMSDTTNGAIVYATDKITFSPVTKPETIEIDWYSVDVQLEDYINNIKIADDRTTTNIDESIYMVPGKTGNDATTLSLTEKELGAAAILTIPVKVIETGYYSVEAVMAHQTDSQISLASFSTEARGVFLTNAKDTYLAEDLSRKDADGNSTYFDETYGAAKFESRVLLFAGEQELTLTIAQRALDGKNCFVGDYIKFVPVESEAVALDKTAETRIEIEDYNDNFNIKGTVATSESHPGNQASEGSYLAWDTAAQDTDLFGEIFISVPRSGAYNVEMIAASADGSVPCLYVDNKMVTGSMEKLSTEVEAEDGSYPYFARADFAAYKVTARIYLSEGEHWITASITRGTTLQGIAGCLDYIAFTADNAPTYHIAAEGTSVMQFEDYINYTALDELNFVTGSIATYEKGTVLNMTEMECKDGLYLSVPVMVEEGGMYDIEAILSLSNGEDTSIGTLYIDGSTIMCNNNGYSILDVSKSLDGTIDYVNEDYPMHRFGARIFLAKGEHTLTYYVKHRAKYPTDDAEQEADAAEGIYRVCNIADKIQFTHLESYAYDTGSVVVVQGFFTEYFEGKGIVALYAGEEMVGISISNIYAPFVGGIVEYTKKPDTAKVFVWKDLESMVPLTEAQVLNVE